MARGLLRADAGAKIQVHADVNYPQELRDKAIEQNGGVIEWDV